MAVKIRMQRHGKKGQPFFHIVAADARAKRDGRYIERLGSYNPNTNPATIVLDNDAAVRWLQNGAQPTDTARAILSYKGAMLKNHLLRGVQKGALTEEQAEKKFQTWMDEKDGKIQSKRDNLQKDADTDRTTRLTAEKAISDKRAAEIAAANSELVNEVAETPEAAVSEAEGEASEAVAEVKEVVAEEAPAEKAKEEAPAEEAPVAEAAKDEAPAEEAPAAEEAKEEAPAEEAKEEAPAKDKKEEGDKA